MTTRPDTPAAPPDGRDPATWSAAALAVVQAALDHGRARAGAAVRDTFDHADRQMTAAEFVVFWNGIRLKAMATSGPTGDPHAAPVHAEFVDGVLRSTVYEHAVRRRDLRSNPRVTFTTWGPHGAAAILHGIAREVPDSLRDTRPGAGGNPRRVVTLEIEVTRIHAMKDRA